MPSVMHILPEMNEGGVERYVVTTARAQCALGERVFVASAGGALVSELPSECEHIVLPTHRKNVATGIACAREIARIASENGIDVLHAHSRVPMWIAYFARNFAPRLSLVCTIHAKYSKNLGTWPYSRVDAAMCVSRAAADDFAYRLARVPIVRVIYCSLPREPRAWSGDGARGDMLFVGRLTPKKGLSTVIEAMSIAASRDVRLTVAGDGPMRGELEAAAETLGVSDRVSFLGRVDDPSVLMARCGVFLFPSYEEGFGLSLAEALSGGVPVLASDIEATRELTRGRTIAPRDAHAWANAIDEWMAGEFDAPTRLAVDVPTPEELARRVIDVYEEAAAPR